MAATSRCAARGGVERISATSERTRSTSGASRSAPRKMRIAVSSPTPSATQRERQRLAAAVDENGARARLAAVERFGERLGQPLEIAGDGAGVDLLGDRGDGPRDMLRPIGDQRPRRRLEQNARALAASAARNKRLRRRARDRRGRAICGRAADRRAPPATERAAPPDRDGGGGWRRARRAPRSRRARRGSRRSCAPAMSGGRWRRRARRSRARRATRARPAWIAGAALWRCARRARPCPSSCAMTPRGVSGWRHRFATPARRRCRRRAPR